MGPSKQNNGQRNHQEVGGKEDNCVLPGFDGTVIVVEGAVWEGDDSFVQVMSGA